MSNKTIMKRIALTAVTAVGIGMVSAIPSQATIAASSVSIVGTNGTAGRNDVNGASHGKSDSTSAGTVTVSFQHTSTADSVIITSVAKSFPTGAGSPELLMVFGDTATSTVVDSLTVSMNGASKSVTAGS